MRKDRVPNMDVNVVCRSVSYLLNATLLFTPLTLIFLFKRALSGSNLVFLGGAASDQQTGKERKRGGR